VIVGNDVFAGAAVVAAVTGPTDPTSAKATARVTVSVAMAPFARKARLLCVSSV
jgi:hypothetical protein